MAITRFALNWLAPMYLLFIGCAGLIAMTGAVDADEPRQGLRPGDPWFITLTYVIVLLFLGLVGGLRLLQVLRRRRA
jgi:hypothetical protein